MYDVYEYQVELHNEPIWAVEQVEVYSYRPY